MNEITINDLSYPAIKIITLLANSPSLTYTQTRPENLDNNLFKYHLEFLQNKGLVSKNHNQYSLTDFGKRISQNLSLETGPKNLFKVSVLCYVYDQISHPTHILLHKRLRHPYFGDIETVAGKVLPGEKVEFAAARKLLEETGLSATFSLIGQIRKIREFPKDQIFEDTLYFVCHAFNPAGKLVSSNIHGENYWVEITQAEKIIMSNITYSPLSGQIFKNASTNQPQPFFFHHEHLLLHSV